MNTEDIRVSLKVAILGSCISRDAFRFQSQVNNYEIVSNLEHSSLFTLDYQSFPIEFEELQFPDNVKVPAYDKKMFFFELTKRTKQEFFAAKDIDLLVVDLAIERYDHMLVSYEGVQYDILNTSRFMQWFSQINGVYRQKPIEIVGNYSLLDIPKVELVDRYKTLFDQIYAQYPNIKVIVVEAQLANETIVKEHKVVPFAKFRNVERSNRRLAHVNAALKEALSGRAVSYIPTPSNVLADCNHIWGLHPLHMVEQYYVYLMECIDNICGFRFTNSVQNLCAQLYNTNVMIKNALNNVKQIQQLQTRIDELESIIVKVVPKRKLNKLMAERKEQK